jgi:hypothetical protein
MTKNKTSKTAPAAAEKIARNPSDKTARGMYDAVVAQEGTVGGAPARIALYGTKYAALEVGGEGAWQIDHDTAFGGVRAIESLKGGFDEVIVLGGDMREIQLTAGNVAVVEPESFGIVGDESKGAGGMSGVPLADLVAPAPGENVVEGLAVLPAPVVAAEPTYATLDEVRAAYEAETRGACRTSVLRALRTRAGEIALGIEVGGKAAKAATAPRVRPATPWADAVAARFASDPSPLTAADGEALGLPPSAFKFSGGWAPAGGLGAALAAKGLRGKLRKGVVVVEALPAV